MSLPALVVSAFAAGFAGVNEREPLHEAAYTGNILQAHFALLRCPNAVNEPKSRSKEFPSPVHIAARRNRIGVLKLLIARGSNVNDPGKAGDTPLHFAVNWGSTEAAELLLKHGAALDIFSAVALDKWQEVQLWFRVASYFGLQNKLANASVTYPGGQKPILNWAIDGGHFRMVEILVNHGADVNPFQRQPDWGEIPPLHTATKKGRYDIAELLIRSGANLDAPDRNGCTALHMAVARKDIDAARYLLKHGAGPDRKQDVGLWLETFTPREIPATLYTPLHLAVDVESPELVALLLAHGASPTARDKRDRNPLDIASELESWQESELGWFFGLASTRKGSEEPSSARELCIKLLYRYGGKPTKPQK